MVEWYILMIAYFLPQLTIRVALNSTNLVKGETACTQSNLTICLPLMCFVTKQRAVGGGQVFQKRLDGSVDFYLNWSDYKHGFGDLSGEFWLGLENVYRLTSDDNNTMRVDLEDFEGNTSYAEYDMFGVMSESDKHKLILGSYSGKPCESSALLKVDYERQIPSKIISYLGNRTSLGYFGVRLPVFRTFQHCLKRY